MIPVEASLKNDGGADEGIHSRVAVESLEIYFVLVKMAPHYCFSIGTIVSTLGISKCLKKYNFNK
jgi:hypothetical protein